MSLRPHYLRVGGLRLEVHARRCPRFVVVGYDADDIRRLLDRDDVELLELHTVDNGGPGELWGLCRWRAEQ